MHSGSIALILSSLSDLGLDGERLSSLAPGIDSTPLGRIPAGSRRAGPGGRDLARSETPLRGDAPTGEVRRQVNARLARLPAPERRYWQKIAAGQTATDSLFFLALSLNADGKPIPVVNTDIATGMFLENFTASGDPSGKGTAERDASTLVLPYPVGLLVDSLGPVVANDAYASPGIWERFSKDSYHSPRVVWGREVNLISLGLAKAPGRALQSWLQRILTAVDASGLGHNELWSYRIEGDRLRPTRYGSSSDVQLWNTTDLAVEFVLSRLGMPPQ